MKYLKKFNDMINESYDENEIDAICEKYGIKNYTINEDGSIDVNGDVNLSYFRLKVLPLKFRNVHGDFKCNINNDEIKGRFYNYSNAKLRVLKNTDELVKTKRGDNRLISLEGAPIHVGGDFECHGNRLKSLKGIPKDVGGGVYSSNNNIKNIDYLPYRYNILDLLFNPINILLKLFLKTNKDGYIIKNDFNHDLISNFKEREIIQNDIIILDRLLEFLDDIGKPKSKEELYDLLKQDYKIKK